MVYNDFQLSKTSKVSKKVSSRPWQAGGRGADPQDVILIITSLAASKRFFSPR